MKRVLAVISVFAVLFCISSCGKKIYFDQEEYEKNISRDNASYAAEASKKSKELNEAKEDILDEYGKSKKGDKLVVRLIYGIHEEYIQFNFKDGYLDSKITTMFYEYENDYQNHLNMGDDGNNKLIEHDKDKKMLKYKNSEKSEYSTYDSLYKRYSQMDPAICTIME